MNEKSARRSLGLPLMLVGIGLSFSPLSEATGIDAVVPYVSGFLVGIGAALNWRDSK